MSDISAQCQWPPLAEPYNLALREAVNFISHRFTPQAILICGSIVRGQGNPNSDLDIHVIHSASFRQRIQRYFRGVPVEIFVNPAQRTRAYFEDEQKAGRPCTAHMFSTGFVMYDPEGVLTDLRSEAQTWLTKKPDLSQSALTIKRYLAADQFENARDIAQTEPVNSALLLHQAVYAMLAYWFLKNNHYLPRHKEFLAVLQKLNPAVAELTQKFYTAQPEARLAIAEQIADLTIETHGFFEWESEPEAA